MTDLFANNKLLHDKIVNGLKVSFLKENIEIGDIIKLIDFDVPGNNDWLIVNQFTVNNHKKRTRFDSFC